MHGAYHQSLGPLPGTGRIVCAIRGPRSLAGFMEGLMLPPKARIRTKIQGPMSAGTITLVYTVLSSGGIMYAFSAIIKFPQVRNAVAVNSWMVLKKKLGMAGVVPNDASLILLSACKAFAYSSFSLAIFSVIFLLIGSSSILVSITKRSFIVSFSSRFSTLSLQHFPLLSYLMLRSLLACDLHSPLLGSLIAISSRLGIRNDPLSCLMACCVTAISMVFSLLYRCNMSAGRFFFISFSSSL
mmetsp:Transcript_24648/g.55690  ORF Transcript_24648/g.55690 Transcript_24648/m.55690 type:complete len:241 (+) Transcript_24648:1188-1910(+)